MLESHRYGIAPKVFFTMSFWVERRIFTSGQWDSSSLRSSEWQFWGKAHRYRHDYIRHAGVILARRMGSLGV